MSFAVLVEGLADLEELRKLKPSIATSAARAVNYAATTGRTLAARRIQQQVNFPARYVDPAGGRLTVVQKATKENLQAVIRARQRPTSLARFLLGTPKVNKSDVTVEVEPGKARRMKRAFVVRLPAGRNIDTKSNLGLAIRLKPGEQLSNKKDAAVRLAKNLYLLYGPSVDQVFRARDGRGVAEDMTPEVAELLEVEFLRQVDLKLD